MLTFTGFTNTNHHLVPSNQYVKMMFGHVVRSIKGRDNGRLYVVIAEDAQGRAVICDGKIRTLDRPKVKNPIHLEKVDNSPEIAALIKSRQLTDADIRQVLSSTLQYLGEEVHDIDQRRCD